LPPRQCQPSVEDEALIAGVKPFVSHKRLMVDLWITEIARSNNLSLYLHPAYYSFGEQNIVLVSNANLNSRDRRSQVNKSNSACFRGVRLLQKAAQARFQDPVNTSNNVKFVLIGHAGACFGHTKRRLHDL